MDVFMMPAPKKSKLRNDEVYIEKTSPRRAHRNQVVRRWQRSRCPSGANATVRCQAAHQKVSKKPRPRSPPKNVRVWQGLVADANGHIN